MSTVSEHHSFIDQMFTDLLCAKTQKEITVKLVKTKQNRSQSSCEMKYCMYKAPLTHDKP